MKRFEYKRVQMVSETELNALGAEGWELVDILWGKDLERLFFYFKREVGE